MPFIRRRSLLAGASGLLAVTAGTTGCTADAGDDGLSPAERRRRADAGRELRRAAARDSEVLLSRYTSTAAAHPALAERLAPLRDAVARHVEAFGGGGRGTQPRGDRDGPDGNHTAVPGDPERARAALADAERRTADARTRALVDAPPELARLLASVAASGSTHALLLTEGERT